MVMEVITSLATSVLVFHRGREIARGGPQEVTGNLAVIEAYLGKRAAKAAASHTPIELGRTCAADLKFLQSSRRRSASVRELRDRKRHR